MADRIEKFVVYPRRYFILILLGLFTATNFYQHYEFASITNIIADFYGLSVTTVNWTSLLYNIGSVVMFYPIVLCIEKLGFQTTTILVTFFNALGPSLKCFALNRNSYGLLLLGQSLPAFVTIVMPSLSAVFAANWFKSEHIATVISLNIVFLNFGSAAAFLSPSIVFSGLTSKSDIFNSLSLISIILALITNLIFILSVLIVREKPPTAPSFAQHSREHRLKNRKLSELFHNKNYLLLTVVFSIILAISQTLTVVLNQSILTKFPNEYHIVTFAGLLSLASGMLSSPLTGFVCKRCKRYKMLLIIYTCLLIVFLTFYAISLSFKNEIILYVMIFMSGFAYSSVYVLAMDFIAEVTYPFSEAITINVSTVVACLPAIFLLPLTSSLITEYGSFAGNLVLIISAVISLIASLLVTEDMRRLKVDTECLPLNRQHVNGNSVK